LKIHTFARGERMSCRGEYVFMFCERRSTYRIQIVILFEEVYSIGISNDASVSVAMKQLSASRQPTWLSLERTNFQICLG
jgi:hypothetical protein